MSRRSRSPINRPSLQRTERVIGHLAIVWNARRGIRLPMTRPHSDRFLAHFLSPLSSRWPHRGPTRPWVGFRRNGAGSRPRLVAVELGHETGIKHPVVQFWNGVSAVLGPVRCGGLAWSHRGGAGAAQCAARWCCRLCAAQRTCHDRGKGLANRPRPSTMLASAPSSSFPSGTRWRRPRSPLRC